MDWEKVAEAIRTEHTVWLVGRYAGADEVTEALVRLSAALGGLVPESERADFLQACLPNLDRVRRLQDEQSKGRAS